jgi:hypothetical protein
MTVGNFPLSELEVNSRSQLVSQLFFEQYLPRTQAGFGLDADGLAYRPRDSPRARQQYPGPSAEVPRRELLL